MARSGPGAYAAIAVLAGAFALALVARPAQGADWGAVKGSGTITKVARSVSAFNTLALELPAKLEIVQGDTEGLTIETDDNIAPLIETLVEHGELKLRFKQRHTSINVRSLRITVQARNLQGLSISGSGEIRAAALKADSLRCAIAGSGSMQLGMLDVDKLALSIGGSGDFDAAGRAAAIDASIAGSGSLRAPRLAASRIKLSIAGSGDARVWAKETLAVNIAGAGDVAYYGDAQVSQSVLGSGSIKRLGSAP